MTKAIRNTKGFSLLELLIALAILSVGMLGLLGMQISGAQGNASSQKLTIATTLAQTGMEDYMARSTGDALFASTAGTDDSNPANDPTYDLDPSSADNFLVYQGVTYTATYFIIPNNPVAGVAKFVLLSESEALIAHKLQFIV